MSEDLRQFLLYVLTLTTEAKTPEEALIAYGRIRESAAMTLEKLERNEQK